MSAPEPASVVRSRTSEMEAQTQSKGASVSTTEQEENQPKPKTSLLRRIWRSFVTCISYKHPYPLLALLTFLTVVNVGCSIARIPLLALIFNVDHSGHKFGYWYLIVVSLLNITTNIITRPRQWSKFSTWYQEEYRLWLLARGVVLLMNCFQGFASTPLNKASALQGLVGSIMYLAVLFRWLGYIFLPVSMKQGVLSEKESKMCLKVGSFFEGGWNKARENTASIGRGIKNVFSRTT